MKNMNTLKITKKDLDENNKYIKGFIGKWNEYEDTSVEIEEGLGYVFKLLEEPLQD